MASKPDIWMPLYIGDYLADTAHLDAEKSGAYLHLLMHYWRKGPLIDDLDSLASTAKLRPLNASSIIQALLDEFFVKNGDGRWHQKRQDIEREKWQKNKDSAVKRAAAAAAARWAIAPSNAPSNAPSMLESCPSPSPSPSPSPLPSPSPSPLPTTQPKNGRGIDPEMLARQVPINLGLAAGMGPGSLFDALYEVAKIERDAGRTLEDVAAEMEAAWHVYQEEKPKLRIQWGAAKFFGEHWRESPESWPHKEQARQSDRDAKRKAFMEASLD